MTDDISQEELGARAAADYQADVYFFSGEIDDYGFGQLAQAMTVASTERRCAVLILVTNGGSANSAYQMARLFQRTYEKFILFTPSYCKSAGTIVALGAHQLIMDPFSELGPLDVQLAQQNELGGRKSGLLLRSSFEGLQEEAFDLFETFMLRIMRRSRGRIGFKIAAELSVSMTSALMAPVYAQINPDTVGNDRRNLEVALDYGRRLASVSGNASSSAIQHLVSHYPSHDFIIDFEEAGELFGSVSTPSQALYELVGSLGDDAYDEAAETVVKALHDAMPRREDGDEDEERTTFTDAAGSDDQSEMDDRRDEHRPSDSQPGGVDGVRTSAG